MASQRQPQVLGDDLRRAVRIEVILAGINTIEKSRASTLLRTCSAKNFGKPTPRSERYVAIADAWVWYGGMNLLSNAKENGST